MALVAVNTGHPYLVFDLAYASENNFTGRKIYARADCYLHQEALEKLYVAAKLGGAIGYKLKIFDAFRPSEAQWKLWDICPDETFVAHPEKGSPHSRGAAVDLTLTTMDNQELEMGTPFDDFTELSFHKSTNVSKEAQQNRFILLGLMTAAGWDFYENEWWHYQLFNARTYPLLSDSDLPVSMMKEAEAA